MPNACIDPAILDRLEQLSRAAASREVYALLGGREDTRQMDRIALAGTGSPHSFHISPRHILLAMKELNLRGKTLLGVFHSHPHSGNGALSRADRARAWPELAQLVGTFETPPAQHPLGRTRFRCTAHRYVAGAWRAVPLLDEPTIARTLQAGQP